MNGIYSEVPTLRFSCYQLLVILPIHILLTVNVYPANFNRIKINQQEKHMLNGFVELGYILSILQDDKF